MIDQKKFDLGVKKILQQGATPRLFIVHPKLVSIVKAFLKKIWNKGE